MMNKLSKVISLWLDTIAERLRGYPESQYWRGYHDGIRDMKEWKKDV